MPMSTQIRIIALKITGIAATARRIPRAIGAAVAAFTATLTRPDPPAAGSAEELARFGVRPEQLLEALAMFTEDGTVRPRRLRARFGAALGTNIMSVCEIGDLVSKPEGSSCWVIDSERVRVYEAQHRSDARASDGSADV